MRFANYILLDLIELMDAEHSSCVFAVGASLAPEARTESHERHRQIFHLENFVLVHAGDRDFGSTDKESIFVLDGVDLVAALGELSVADEAEVTRHSGHNQWCETFVGN